MRRLFTTLLLVLLPAVAFGGFRVSSFKKETRLGANHWNAASALDGDPTTCWMVDPETENEGAWFEIDLPKAEIDKLSVAVGWDKSEAAFNDYARIKTIKIEVFDEGQGDEPIRVLMHSLTFEDHMGLQTMDLPDTAFGDEFVGGRVRLTVKEVYAGEDYPNLAVSEVVVHLKQMDAPVAMRTAPESAASGHAADAMHDESDRTFWASSGGAAGQYFYVLADGFGLSSIGIKAGPSSYSRPKTIEVTSNDITHKHTMENNGDVQWFLIPPLVGYTGSGFGGVGVKIIDTYEGSNPEVAITEVKLKATNYEGL